MVQRLNTTAYWAVLSTALTITAEAAAAERLVMPYECRFEGRRVSLRASEARPYEIIGAREQKAHTTCQDGGDLCTTHMIHRFQIACDGVRVPWIRVAAAVPARRPNRHWIKRGQFTMVRPVAETPGSADACAKGAARENSDECLPWKPAPKMERMVLPEGFAPLGLAKARIDVDGAPHSAPDQIAGVIAAMDGAKSAAGQKISPGSPPGPAGQGTGTLALPPNPKTPPRKPEKMMVVEAIDLSEKSGPAQSRSNMLWGWLGGLAGLALIAFGVRRIPSGMGRDVARIVSRRVLRMWVHLRWQISAISLKSPAPELAAAHAEAEDPALANAAWAAATLLDQIDQSVNDLQAGSPLRAVLEEELATIHQRLVATRASALDGGSQAKAASQFRALVRELERVKRIANSAVASASPARHDVTVPKTKSEAYQLLGVNADVNETILKKLVDALRMTWHPDYARDEPDRLLREERIKQINVAWELISAKKQVAA